MLYTLYDHQKKTVEFAKDKPAVFDASDPGTGKTLVQIDLISKRSGKTLIVCPKTLMRSAWAKEIRTFAPHLRYVLLTAETRSTKFDTNADVYITNHDAATWLEKQSASFFKDFSTLIIDESGAFKNRTSQRSRAMKKIAKYFAYRSALNGTPNPNTILDLWHQIYLLDDGQHLGKSFVQFRESVCTPVRVGPMPYMVEWKDKPGIQQVIYHLLKDIMIRHQLEDVVDMPEHIIYEIPFFMSKKQYSVYAQLLMSRLATLGTQSITAINGAAEATKLLQVASGAVYTDDDNYALIDDTRYNLVLDLVEARQHSIVFFLWKHQKDMLLKTASERGISHSFIDGTISDKTKAEIVDRFQKGYYRVLFLHPKSASHGLTLTKATTTIWTSPTYNSEHFEQGNRRIYRVGQNQRTETIVILAQDTIEQRVYKEILMGKMRNMADFLTLFLQESKNA